MADIHVVYISLLTLVIVVVIGFYYYHKRLAQVTSSQPSQDSLNLLSQWASEIRSGMDRQSEMISRQLVNANEALHQRLESTTQLLRLLNKDLGEVHQVGQQMRDFQHFFRAPQLRGKLGEQLMSEILFQIIPHSFIKLQHRFQSGAVIDALLMLEQGSISIDAKFPLENFQKSSQAATPELAALYQKEFYKDVRRHIEAVRSKYILPDEGTLDFAVLYVPSETLYYEILQHDKLVREAESQNVLLVSPHSFYYLLRLFLYGLYSKKLEKTAVEVMQHINSLQTGATEILRELGTLINHLNNAKNSGERVQHRIQALAGKIEDMTYFNKDKLEG